MDAMNWLIKIYDDDVESRTGMAETRVKPQFDAY